MWLAASEIAEIASAMLRDFERVSEEPRHACVACGFVVFCDWQRDQLVCLVDRVHQQRFARLRLFENRRRKCDERRSDYRDQTHEHQGMFGELLSRKLA